MQSDRRQTEDPSHLEEIAYRHERDRWRDAIFIGVAVLFCALALGTATSGGVGRTDRHPWSVTVVDPSTNLEINR
jgi:hypothetical protein